MKTNEELQGMTHDELVAYTQNLQRESEEYKKSMLYYLDNSSLNFPGPKRPWQ